jgi:methylated-DNA-[protein]-cysteine S-methyltransferase/AraC family transcriptional regulator of adaptative response/methylated-DNA-[protein]-cysteine methyltransferase
MELARWISPLPSPRAVGNACAANPIAPAIPCHRVVRSNGDLAGYCWGIERKRGLILEAAMA